MEGDIDDHQFPRSTCVVSRVAFAQLVMPAVNEQLEHRLGPGPHEMFRSVSGRCRCVSHLTPRRHIVLFSAAGWRQFKGCRLAPTLALAAPVVRTMDASPCGDGDSNTIRVVVRCRPFNHKAPPIFARMCVCGRVDCVCVCSVRSHFSIICRLEHEPGRAATP